MTAQTDLRAGVKATPMMEQYFNIKKDYRHCLLFFRLGDFYELFFEDAHVASKELDIVLTGKEWGQAERAPMCGVPFHSADGYIAKLISKGYKVAICEQVEDPKQAKTIVRRAVTRVVTPGTVTDEKALEEGKNNYILCVCESGASLGAAVCDVSTGEFAAFDYGKDDVKALADEAARYNPREIIVNGGFTGEKTLEAAFGVPCAKYNEWCFDYNNAYVNICNHFNVLNLNGYGLEDKKGAVRAAGALLYYLSETQKNSLGHITSIKSYRSEQYMVLDIPSRRNLELTENAREKNVKGSLLWVLDKTKTAMGARLLRNWINRPLIDADEINLRLNAADEFFLQSFRREEIKECLRHICDMERVMGRVVYGAANARDMAALQNALSFFPQIKSILAGGAADLFINLYNEFDILNDIYALIEAAITDDPPFSVREGGFIKRGYSADLDGYYAAKNEGASWLLDMENAEKEQTGIKNLRIRFNKVFGYYIEVTNSYQHLAPDRYIRKQTLANCERYTTEELKKIEDAILTADEKITELEFALFTELRETVAAAADRILKGAGVVAALDCLQSFAEAAEINRYVKPAVDGGGVIDIKDGRHPVVEQTHSDSFIPNDIYLDGGENRVLIVTGPNMAGKSTYMRQAAVIVLMAQIGSFVPASYARIGVVDRIFTRAGASDDLATGQSTFMVEMSEVANILNNATANSLLVLDEIGRGTSTYDGLSIAWAVMEYIADIKRVGAKTLFATHYHELTELEGQIGGVKNFCVTVQENDGEIVFLRKIARGGAQASYGINVAQLAGIPARVVKRSKEILSALGDADITRGRGRRAGTGVTSRIADDVPDGMAVYEPGRGRTAEDMRRDRIINEITDMDIDAMSPRAALLALYELKNKIKIK